jgi:hypothetical protein
VTVKRPRWAQPLQSATEASAAGFLWFGEVKLDLFVHRAVHNAGRKSGLSGRPVRRASSPIHSQTMQVLTHADATPSPIDDNVGYKTLWVDLALLRQQVHAGTIDTFYRFPAAPMYLSLSS